jgi:hypothetical protein
MRTSIRIGLACAVALTLPFAGCNNAPPPAPPVAQNGDAHDDHDHAAHDDHGHDHDAHAHGPHEGELVELGGGKFHGEVVHQHDEHLVIVYLLGADAKTATPVAATEVSVNLMVAGKPSQFKIPAAPDAADPAGKSSRFELKDEALCDALDAADAKARLNAEIEGQAFTGEIAHHAHEGHDH